ncbi:MAG: hypothetical protein HY366_00990 [Candidatus Aenigmarchaeota archaeon]|nr:hypothetical protein [Candidatus Aenigmarchaeota archaeon]
MGISYKVINTRQADADEIERKSNDYAKEGHRLKSHKDGVMVFERERLTPEEIQEFNDIHARASKIESESRRSW